MLENGYSPSDLIDTLTPNKVLIISLPYYLDHKHIDLQMICDDWRPTMHEDNMNKLKDIFVFIWNKL